jgi:hypothetical protein
MFISESDRKASKQLVPLPQLQSSKKEEGSLKERRNCLNSFTKHLNISHNSKSYEKSKKGQKEQKWLVTDLKEREQSLGSVSQMKPPLKPQMNSVFRPVQVQKDQVRNANSEEMARNPKLGKWSFAEQTKCFNFFLEHLADWKLISDKLGNRNLNSIKNLFYSSIRSIKKSFSGTFFKKLVNSSCKSLCLSVSNCQSATSKSPSTPKRSSTSRRISRR